MRDRSRSSDVRRAPLRPRAARFVAVLALLAGCRQDMYDQPRYEPLEPSAFFADGASARPLVPGTVARADPRGAPRKLIYAGAVAGQFLGDAAAYAHYYTGKVDGKDAETFPFPITRADLDRGRQRYMIFCAPCHGATGDGQGMIVRRGFSPPPPLYGPRPQVAADSPVPLYDDLRKAPVGHFFDVMTNGRGTMYSYAERIPPDDRWKIAAYIRALQLSRYATVDDLKAIEDPLSPERRLLQEVGP